MIVNAKTDEHDDHETVGGSGCCGAGARCSILAVAAVGSVGG